MSNAPESPPEPPPAPAGPPAGPPRVGAGAAAYRRLREAILHLELPPAAPVSEQQLTERFALSRAAVRAALARLRAEGLVLAEARRGHVIAPLTLRDVREVYDLRLVVEPPAADQAAGRLPAADLDRLAARLAAPAGAAGVDGAAGVGDVRDGAALTRFLDANRAVHVTVAAATGNRRLGALVERLLDESERAIVLALRSDVPGGALRPREEHLALLAALRAGDGAAARRHMAAAISRFRGELLEILQSTSSVLDASLTR